MSPQFVTLCCKIQQALIDLYFTVDKEAFKRLLTYIKTGSFNSLSDDLRRTQWCREFHFKCGEIATVLEAGCEHLKNRKRRDLQKASPTNPTSKQINSTSFTGKLNYAHLYM